MIDMHTNTQISLSADMLQIKLSNLRGYYSRELNKVKNQEEVVPVRKTSTKASGCTLLFWTHF